VCTRFDTPKAGDGKLTCIYAIPTYEAGALAMIIYDTGQQYYAPDELTLYPIEESEEA
jgi:hypothetical protein